MNRNSESVKKWRHNTKKRIVESMGGKCLLCGYNKCNRGLDVHHLNVNKKEFSLSNIMARPRSWEKIVSELRKCILVCCRCHMEIHDGIIDISLYDKSNFNEKYSKYNNFKEEEFDECPICGKEKRKFNKTCSHKCAAKMSYKVDWDNVDLKDMMNKGMSYNKIGGLLNVSGVCVKKRAKRIGLI